MHAQQKAAWFNLIVFAGTVALYLALVPLLRWGLNWPWKMAAITTQAVFGLCGLWGFGGFFYTPKHDSKPLMDERDHLLARFAWRAGMGAFWGVFILGCMGSWAIMQYRGLQYVTVPVGFFPWMVFAGMIIFGLTQSLATLHYYGWRWIDDSPAK
jgi:hypothetical protein